MRNLGRGEKGSRSLLPSTQSPIFLPVSSFPSPSPFTPATQAISKRVLLFWSEHEWDIAIKNFSLNFRGMDTISKIIAYFGWLGQSKGFHLWIAHPQNGIKISRGLLPFLRGGGGLHVLD